MKSSLEKGEKAIKQVATSPEKERERERLVRNAWSPLVGMQASHKFPQTETKLLTVITLCPERGKKKRERERGRSTTFAT